MNSDSRALVLVVEDEVLVRTTIANIIDFAGFKVIAVANAAEALQVLEHVPQVKAVITDVEMPGGMNGFQLAQRIRDRWQIGVVIVSGRATPEHDDLPPEVFYLAKPVHSQTLTRLVEDLIGSSRKFEEVVANDPPERAQVGVALTKRQKDVLKLLADGKSNREIAQALELSENTVKVHITAIFHVLGVTNRTEAAVASKTLLLEQ